jgi:hypothetical protein
MEYMVVLAIFLPMAIAIADLAKYHDLFTIEFGADPHRNGHISWHY